MQELISEIKPYDPAITEEVIGLLKKLIETASFSKEEQGTALLLDDFLKRKKIRVNRMQNNIWVINKNFDPKLPAILLNSHHDTVKPNKGYTKDPLRAEVIDGKLYGLGSTDAGGALVSLLATFLHFYDADQMKYNLIFAATAEEEISGVNGIASIVDQLPKIDFALVGEPTEMHLAIAEKGLMVLDCISHGTGGHAARNEGENALYKALADIEWFKDYKFEKESEMLGPIKMNVTQIEAGTQHNVIPAQCKFTVDVRTTDVYSNREILALIKEHVNCEVNARSLRLQPSSISIMHPFVQAGIKLGRSTYGSPTLSDQALMPWPSVKIGPGNSARSHSADEFIYLEEIKEGIDLYIKMLNSIVL